MSLSSDNCPLCGRDWDFHKIRTQQVRLPDGRRGVEPTGWDCPPRPKEAVRHASEEG